MFQVEVHESVQHSQGFWSLRFQTSGGDTFKGSKNLLLEVWSWSRKTFRSKLRIRAAN